jgi:hypothetical protein
MLQLGVQDGFQGLQFDLAVVVLAIDEQRRRTHDPHVAAVFQIVRHGLADFRRVDVGFEALHIQPDGRGQRQNRGTAQVVVAGKQGVVHLPELALLLRGDRGGGGQRGLRMHVQRELFEEQPDLLG